MIKEAFFIGGQRYVKDYDKNPEVGDYVVTEHCSGMHGMFFREGFIGEILDFEEPETFFIDFNYEENSFVFDDGQFFCERGKLTRLFPS